MLNIFYLLGLFLFLERALPYQFALFNDKYIELSLSGRYFKSYKLFSFPRSVLGLSFVLLAEVAHEFKFLRNSWLVAGTMAVIGMAYFAIAWRDITRAAAASFAD